MQGFFLYAGQWMLLDPQHMMPLLGLPFEPGGTLNLFLVMVLLWTTVRVPTLIRRIVTHGGGGPTFLGTVVRVIVVQQLSRSIPGLGHAARAVRVITR